MDLGLSGRSAQNEVSDVEAGHVVVLEVAVVVRLEGRRRDADLGALAGVGERRTPQNDVDVVGVDLRRPVAAWIEEGGARQGPCGWRVRAAVGIRVEYAVSRGQHDPGGDQRPAAELPVVRVAAAAEDDGRLPRILRDGDLGATDDLRLDRPLGLGPRAGRDEHRQERQPDPRTASEVSPHAQIQADLPNSVQLRPGPTGPGPRASPCGCNASASACSSASGTWRTGSWTGWRLGPPAPSPEAARSGREAAARSAF